MKIFLIHIFMCTFWYYVNIYWTRDEVVYHIAQNILNELLLSYNLFFIIYWCKLNYPWPNCLKQIKLVGQIQTIKKYSRHIANTFFFFGISLNSVKNTFRLKGRIFRNCSLLFQNYGDRMNKSEAFSNGFPFDSFYIKCKTIVFCYVSVKKTQTSGWPLQLRQTFQLLLRAKQNSNRRF